MSTLERKSWVDVLVSIGAGALMIGAMVVGGAVWVAGKEMLKYLAKEKIMEAFLSEEDNIKRKLRELARPIYSRERMLEEGPIEDWRGRDASGEIRGELDRMLAQRTELEERLAEIEAARREVEDIPTDEDQKSLPGAHGVYR